MNAELLNQIKSSKQTMADGNSSSTILPLDLPPDLALDLALDFGSLA